MPRFPGKLELRNKPSEIDNLELETLEAGCWLLAAAARRVTVYGVHCGFQEAAGCKIIDKNGT